MLIIVLLQSLVFWTKLLWYFIFNILNLKFYVILIFLHSLQIIFVLISNGTYLHSVQFSSVQPLSCVPCFATPWTAAHQASLSFTNPWSLPKIMSIVSVMPSDHLILCHSLLILPSIFPTIRVFSNESALLIRWPKYWSYSFKSVLPMNTQDWFPLGWTGWTSLQSKGLSRVFSSTTVQKHQFFSAQLSL